MTADRRNTSVVIALILSMTLGLSLLLGLEGWIGAKRPNWSGDTMLAAERGGPVQVEVCYAASAEEAAGLAAESSQSLLIIDPRGEPRVERWRVGALVRVVLVGSDAPELSDAQKRMLLAALGAFSQDSGVDVVPVRLAPDSDPERNPELPPQAGDLRRLLVRKGIIQ